MKNIFKFAICLALLQSINISYSQAEESKPLIDFADKSRWIIRFRAISVDPDEDSTVTGATTADITAKSKATPELDFSYFFTDNIAAELILATSKHDMGTNAGHDLGSVWVLPPTINLQYHFNRDAQFRPYVGAGLGYIMYYNIDSGPTFSSIKYKNGVAYSLQAGFDISMDPKDNWALNVDIKKLHHNTSANVNHGTVNADVDLDPWVFGIGVAYKF